jgi:hypothetical protein
MAACTGALHRSRFKGGIYHLLRQAMEWIGATRPVLLPQHAARLTGPLWTVDDTTNASL